MMKMAGLFSVILFVVATVPSCGKTVAIANVEDSVILYQPTYDYEHVPDASYDLVADRVACIQSDIPLTYNERVKSFIDYFTVRDREYTRMVIRRKDIYFPIFEKYLKKHNLPQDLKYLAIVESGLKPEARSRVGAVGLWQFMPSTGRMFGLNRDWYIDERQDPEKSTEAACKYLKQLYRMFGDWELALAAYNTGPGNVRKAIRRSGYKKSFWDIYRYLPRETRSYVPQFVAIAYTLSYIDEHNLREEIPEYLVEADTLMVSQFASLKVLAEQLNVCEEDLQRLNPELRRAAVPETAKNYPLRIPADLADFIAANTSSLLDSAGSETIKKQFIAKAQKSSGSTYGRTKMTYRVRRGDVLGKIAERHGVRLSDVRRWNNIRGSRIYAGQRLTLYVKSSNRAVASAARTPVSAGKVHLVQPGDSLWEISRKYQGLTVAKIKQLNNLRTNSIKPGQKLIIGR